MSQLAELDRNSLQAQPPAQQQSGSLAEAELNHDGGVDVWGILSRRKWIVIFFCLLGLGLGYIYLLQASPVFESVAQVLIQERKPPVITMDTFAGGMNYQSEEARHAHMLTSAEVLSRTYLRPEIKKLEATFPDEAEALIDFSDNLTVELVEEGTNLLTISFRGPNPDETQKVVNALIATYEGFLTETYKSEDSETKETLLTASEQLGKKLDKLEQEYAEHRVGEGSELIRIAGEDAVNKHQARQMKYEIKRTQLIEESGQLTARLAEVVDAIQKEEWDAIELMAQQDGSRLIERDNMGYREATQLDRWAMLLMQEEELTRRYADDHPDVLSVRGRIEKFRTIFPDIAEGRKTRRSTSDLKERIQAYVQSLQKRSNEIKSQIKEMEFLYMEEQEEAKGMQAIQAKEERLKSTIERTQETYTAILKSLDEATLVESYQGFNYRRLQSPAIGEKVAPKAIIIMPVAAILGGLCGFGLGYLVDIADKAFRTPDEVSQIMQLPVVGHIPLIDTNKQKLLPDCNVQPVICTVHRPKSPQSESYRAVRTALYFNNRESKHQVIQMTSPMPGDGKSTLAANLAVTIAQSGKKVLLMDADFRRPTLHKVFGINKQSEGLATIVSGESEPLEAMQHIAQCPNLSLLVCGARPANPSELLSSEAFHATIDIFRQNFDYVMIDTPPVLAVSDPCAVAARADGVLLTFRIHKRARPLAVRARDALTNIGANVIGVVVNGVDQEAGGYYSQYRYGYSGYRYAYNYRYGYGYGAYGSEKSETKAINQYFDAEEEPNKQADTVAK